MKDDANEVQDVQSLGAGRQGGGCEIGQGHEWVHSRLLPRPVPMQGVLGKRSSPSISGMSQRQRRPWRIGCDLSFAARRRGVSGIPKSRLGFFHLVRAELEFDEFLCDGRRYDYTFSFSGTKSPWELRSSSRLRCLSLMRSRTGRQSSLTSAGRSSTQRSQVQSPPSNGR